MLTRPALIAVVALAAVMLAGCPSDDPNDGCPHDNDTRATSSTCWHLNADGNRVYHPG